MLGLVLMSLHSGRSAIQGSGWLWATACLLTGDVTSNISLGPELQLSNVKGGGGSDSYDYFSCNT